MCDTLRIFKLFSGYEQINIINDNTFDSNIEMINQVQNQHKDPNNITNSYLDLDVESDFYYNDKFQADITTNKNLKSSVLDQTKSSRNYPRIIENKKCKINMLVLPKSMDSTADSSFNTSILEKSLELSDINISDINISDINIFDTNVTDTNNSKKTNHEILAQNKSMFTSVYGETDLDTTLITLCGLNEVKSSIVNNNGELCYNNPQVANVSLNTGIYTYI